jgi:hypothetical protein
VVSYTPVCDKVMNIDIQDLYLYSLCWEGVERVQRKLKKYLRSKLISVLAVEDCWTVTVSERGPSVQWPQQLNKTHTQDR